MGLKRENTQKIRKVTPRSIIGNNKNLLIIYDNILQISLKCTGVKELTSTPVFIINEYLIIFYSTLVKL